MVSIVHESWHWSCSGSPLGRGEVVASSIQGPILGVGVARLDVLPDVNQLVVKGALQQLKVVFLVSAQRG